MYTYQILTDSCCDLPRELVTQLQIQVANLTVHYDENVTFDEGQMPNKEFYDGIRAGKMPKTSAVNPERWKDLMESVLKEGQDVLVIAFSSGLSTTYQSAVIAGEELKEEYPQRRILVVDSLSAAIGQGMLVWHAANQRAEGKDIESVYNWVLENRLKLRHEVTVEDLMHLKRGGRVSAATAVMGTMLSIKPMIKVDNNGKLETVGKARGRKASIKNLVEKLEKFGNPEANETVFIGHGDCPEDAAYLEEQVKGRFGVKNVITSYVGNVIGSHTGPGVLVIAFFGQER